MNKHAGYKESGVDWIGAIPADWDISKSKYLFGNKSEKNHPGEPLLSVSQKDGVVLRSESDMKVWNPTGDVSAYKLIEPGNFVIGLRSFEGGLELSAVRGIVSPAYTVLETQKKIDSRYFRWLMKSHQFIVELNKNVTGIRQGKTIAWDDFSNIYLTVPPLAEQKLISRFLDGKTRGVDLLIEKIQRKIELLKEQRTALINQCVTKGLNPNVAMKDSGIEWIGQIPAHWDLIRGRFLFTYKKELNKEMQCKNLLSLTLFGVLNKNRESYDGLRPESYSTYQIFQKDDLVFKMIDLENVSTSRVGLVHEEGIMSPVYLRHEPNKSKIAPRFSYWVYYDLYKKEIYNSIGSGVRSSLSSSDLLEIELPVPPIREQKSISHYLDKKTEQIDSLIDKMGEKISILKEYRQSLISAAVTGKIRVTEDML